MPPKIKPTPPTTVTTATGQPISYQQMAQAYARLQAAYPRQNAQVFGINGISDDDFDEDVHIPGIECVDNPFCEECYK